VRRFATDTNGYTHLACRPAGLQLRLESSPESKDSVSPGSWINTPLARIRSADMCEGASVQVDWSHLHVGGCWVLLSEVICKIVLSL
jgi:hypothetical protein